MRGFLFGGVPFLTGIAVYMVIAFALYVIAKRHGHEYPWLAWIPIANIALVLQLGSFNWALIFLALIPFAGWIAILVLEIISLWRIFEKENYPGALALLALIPIGLVIVLAIVAWAKK